MAGKGDKPRPVNKTRYNENYEQITWSVNKEEAPKEVKKVKNKTKYVY
jgi:hypothetical protein